MFQRTPGDRKLHARAEMPLGVTLGVAVVGLLSVAAARGHHSEDAGGGVLLMAPGATYRTAGYLLSARRAPAADVSAAPSRCAAGGRRFAAEAAGDARSFETIHEEA